MSKNHPLLAAAYALLTAMIVAPLSGCLVAGYSSGGGWFIWPGSFGLVIVVIILFLFLRRKR